MSVLRLPPLSLLLLTACGTQLGLGPPALPALATPPPNDWPELAELDATIEGVMQREHIAGASACLIVDREIAWCNGYGAADLEAGRPVTADTPFLMASVSKTVVAVAMARAVQDGLLDLDAPVSDQLGFEVSHPGTSQPAITGRMLAGHVSGIRDNWDVMDPLYAHDADSPVSLHAFLEGYFTPDGTYYAQQQNFYSSGPMQASRYSNVGAALGALLVQEATGEPFERWTEHVIFEPLEMDSASWLLADSDLSTLAVPYRWDQGRYHRIGHYGFADWPSGQLRASATDMAKFLVAFMSDGGGVVDPSTNAAQREIQYPSMEPDQGLLWYRWTLDDAEVWGTMALRPSCSAWSVGTRTSRRKRTGSTRTADLRRATTHRFGGSPTRERAKVPHGSETSHLPDTAWGAWALGTWASGIWASGVAGGSEANRGFEPAARPASARPLRISVERWRRPQAAHSPSEWARPVTAWALGARRIRWLPRKHSPGSTRGWGVESGDACPGPNPKARAVLSTHRSWTRCSTWAVRSTGRRSVYRSRTLEEELPLEGELGPAGAARGWAIVAERF